MIEIILLLACCCFIFIVVLAGFFLTRGEEGDECEGKDDNGTYKLDEDLECVLKSCASGYSKSGKTCVVTPAPGPAPDPVCPRNVTVVRTDAQANWGMDLKFKCGDERVPIGNDVSGTFTKTVGPFNLSKTACPAVISKTNWLGDDQHADTFDVSVSECIDPGETCPRNVTVVRTDNQANWGMDLQFECGEETVSVGNDVSGTFTKTVGPFNLSKTACPAIISKTNWSADATWAGAPDTFDVSVGNCQ